MATTPGCKVVFVTNDGETTAVADDLAPHLGQVIVAMLEDTTCGDELTPLSTMDQKTLLYVIDWTRMVLEHELVNLDDRVILQNHQDVLDAYFTPIPSRQLYLVLQAANFLNNQLLARMTGREIATKRIEFMTCDEICAMMDVPPMSEEERLKMTRVLEIFQI